jgi:glutaminase
MAANNPSLATAHHDPLSTPKWQLWVGRVLSAIPALMLAMSAAMKLSQNPQMVTMLTSKFGYSADIVTTLGLVELACAILYLVPQTAVLGAILVTGYLGGAVATHVRVADAFAIPLVLGILAWAGLYARDERVRALLPLRSLKAAR